MVRISKKTKIEPVREANELAVENEYVNTENVKVVEYSTKEQILDDVKKMCLAVEAMWYNPKLNYSEIEAILNKYL